MMKNRDVKVILVTGGAGYVGSHTAVELIAKGYEVVIVDDLSNSELSTIKGIRQITGAKISFEQIDCQNRSALEKLFKKQHFDAVLHFAASKAVGESLKEPLLYYQNNLVSLINLLDLMSKHRVGNMIFSSSCTVYGQPQVLPVTEQTPRQEASSPYGNTKQICEDILRDTLAAYPHMRGIALRYFNPIGAHPSALIGELSRGVPTNLVPYLAQTAAGVREYLHVFGGDYGTPDGSAIRDYIDVNDLARAHVKALDRIIEPSKSLHNYEFFNIGTGRGLSVLELIGAFEKATGVKVNYRIVERRAGDIEKIWADTSYANQELGWQAECSIEATLASVWRWEKKLRERA